MTTTEKMCPTCESEDGTVLWRLLDESTEHYRNWHVKDTKYPDGGAHYCENRPPCAPCPDPAHGKPAVCPVCGGEKGKPGWRHAFAPHSYANREWALKFPDMFDECRDPFHTAKEAQPSECPVCGDAEVALMWTDVQSRFHSYMTWHRWDDYCDSHQCAPCQDAYHTAPAPAGEKHKPTCGKYADCIGAHCTCGAEPSPLHPGALELANAIMDHCNGVEDGTPWFAVEDAARLISDFAEKEADRAIAGANQDWELMRNERDTLRAENQRLRAALTDALENAKHHYTPTIGQQVKWAQALKEKE